MPKRAEIEESLRGRIRRGLQGGLLNPGDRLPSTRQYAAEFGVDYRVVLAAYQALAVEGLVELRARGGIYVAPSPVPGLPLAVSERWIVDVFVQARSHEMAMRELPEALRRCVETLRLRAAVIAPTTDQRTGLCRELVDDFALEADAVDPHELAHAVLSPALRRADLLVTTAAQAEAVQTLARELGTACVVVELRADLMSGEWRLLLRRPAYLIVEDEAFAELARRFFAPIPEAAKLRILLAREDDLSVIEDEAPVYITRSARAALHGRPIRGRVLPPARMLSADSARAIIRFIVRENLRAQATRSDVATGPPL